MLQQSCYCSMHENILSQGYFSCNKIKHESTTLTTNQLVFGFASQVLQRINCSGIISHLLVAQQSAGVSFVDRLF